MGEFLAYDASQWIYEATLVPIKNGVSKVAQKVRRGGVPQLVVLAGLALAATHIERELPTTQFMSVWESPGSYGSSGNVVPIGHWAKVINRMKQWSPVEGMALPDFDSLA